MARQRGQEAEENLLYQTKQTKTDKGYIWQKQPGPSNPTVGVYLQKLKTLN